MKLVITDKKLDAFERCDLEDLIEGYCIPNVYNGESFKVFKNGLLEYKEEHIDNICVSADERHLLLVPEVFKIDDVYIYRNGVVKPIRECTNKELRNAHNLFKMYIAGAFEF